MTTFVQLPTADDLCALLGDVWASFLGDDIVALESAGAAGPPADLSQVVASVSIAGAWHGHLLLGLSTGGAAAVAAAMFGSESGELAAEELADAVGELGNIVAGNVKSMLPEPSTLSLPQVVFDAQTFAFPSARQRVSTVLAWADHSIAVSLWEAVPAQKGSC